MRACTSRISLRLPTTLPSSSPALIFKNFRNLNCCAALHLELFAGTAQGPLTDRNHPPFMRRGDLVDPTAFLDSCMEVTNNATV